jgi:hypothetical protein
VTDHDHDGRRYRGKVSTPARRTLDLEDLGPEDLRLAALLRRAAEQYDAIGLAALPATLRRAASELDADRRAAVELLAPTATEGGSP